MLEEQLGYSEGKLQEELMMKKDLAVDSLDIINLIVNLEDHFRIELFSSIDGTEDMTVSEFCEYIAENVRKKVSRIDYT